jgi:hypothetical protein
MRTLRAMMVSGMLLVSGAAPALAQVTGPHKLDFIGGSGVGFNGWQVGTYKATLDGAPISIWCTDFFNHSADADVWKTGLGGSDLSKTRFGLLTGQPLQYRRAAALTSLFGTQPTSQWGYIQYAIWELMSDPLPHGGSAFPAAQAQVNHYLTWSLNNHTNYDYSKMFVLTDTRVTSGTNGWPNGCQGITDQTTCGAQEFLTGELIAAPEPATIGLLATGLVGLSVAGFVRRRRQKRDQ